jgi:hypothetical protein
MHGTALCQQHASPVLRGKTFVPAVLLRALPLPHISDEYGGPRPQSKVLSLRSFTTAARAGRALRFIGDTVLFKVVTDQLPDHLRRCQILSRAQFFKRCLFHRVDQNCESSAFRFHGSKQK